MVDIEDAVKETLSDIEDVLWKERLGVHFDFVRVLEKVKEDLEYVLYLAGNEDLDLEDF